MKKVVLLGDSIRLIGYGSYVQQELGEDYNVWQPEENCETCQKTLRLLFNYQEQLKDADVVHWNCGHWDIARLFGEPFTPIDIYERELVKIAEILRRYTDKIIFATTTPTEKTYELNDNKTIDEFNSVAVRCLTPMGVKINDLNGFMSKDIGRYISSDRLHLSEEGAKECARIVAESIKSII